MRKKAVYPFSLQRLFDTEALEQDLKRPLDPYEEMLSYHLAVFVDIVAFGKIPRAGFFPGY
ncbi:hypothetical protein ACQCVP_20385 [Rossellomorea vietnamensis]